MHKTKYYSDIKVSEVLIHFTMEMDLPNISLVKEAKHKKSYIVWLYLLKYPDYINP